VKPALAGVIDVR